MNDTPDGRKPKITPEDAPFPPALILKPAGEKRLMSGHPWIFRNEVERSSPPPDPGALVRVKNRTGRTVGLGLANPASSILIRLLINAPFETSKDVLDMLDQPSPDLAALFRLRLERALAWRGTQLPGVDAVRLVYGESDFLPGVIVDRYKGILVLQIASLGMDRQRDLIVALLRDMVAHDGILERSTMASREKEGLESDSRWLVSPPPDLADGRVWIEENGARFLADTLNGQKTGFYLDQRENRKAARSHARARRVLDCFCYTGAFSVHCALGGANQVVGVDSSRPALEIAARHAEANKVESICRFEAADAIHFLRACAPETFDFILLDPPAFARSKSAVMDAARGYRELNLRAMKILPRHGLLGTSSCSQLFDRERFLSVLHSAARDAHRYLRLITEGTQAADHPILLNIPESRYLKFFLFEVV